MRKTGRGTLQGYGSDKERARCAQRAVGPALEPGGLWGRMTAEGGFLVSSGGSLVSGPSLRCQPWGSWVRGAQPLLPFLESSGDLPVFRQRWDRLLLRGGLVVGGGDGL